MSANVQSRPVFTMDMTNPYEVEEFPRRFATFLQEHGRTQEALDFYTYAKWYEAVTNPEFYSFRTLIAIALQYAEVEDISGEDLLDIPVFTEEGRRPYTISPEEVSEVIEWINKRANSAEHRSRLHPRDRPSRPKPSHPEIVIDIRERFSRLSGDDLAEMVFESLVENGFSPEARQFWSEYEYLCDGVLRKYDLNEESFAKPLKNGVTVWGYITRLKVLPLAQTYVTVRWARNDRSRPRREQKERQ